MVSLPGDSASSERVVTTPYATASNAQTTASSTPWSDRKLDTKNPSGLRQSETTALSGPPYERRESTARLLAGDPESSGGLRRTRSLRVFRGRLARRGGAPPESCT